MKRLPICARLLLASMLGCVSVSIAQEFDSVIPDQGRRPIIVSDEIFDPAERRAFESIYKEHVAAARLQRAEQFLSSYPQSSVLAFVYEIAAKTSIELQDDTRALEYGKSSLELLPENPFLLISIADVQARNGMTLQAEENAKEALEELDRFARPAAISEQVWPDLARQLKATCYFVLGRASAARAFGSHSSAIRDQLAISSAYLAQAHQLNPDDPEMPYLKGLTDLGLGRRDDAMADFVAAYRLGGPLRAKATEQLRRLYEAQAGHAGNFRVFLAGLEREQAHPGSSGLRPRAGSPVVVSSAPEAIQPLPDYAGSEACRPCHADIYDRWSHTGMARMFRPYRPENVLGDFSRQNEFNQDEEALWENGRLKIVPPKARTPFARMVLVHGRHYFDIRESRGWRRYPVDYTIGSKWQQAYATRLPNGEIHVFPIQYSLIAKRWVNFWKIIDSPGSPRADLGRWERVDIWTNYLVNCAVCHTSQLREVRGRPGAATTGAASQNPPFREPGIGCEMCHGPSARHVHSMLKGEFYRKPPSDPPVDFSRISSREFIAICSQCHMQSAIRRVGPGGELNYSSGETFFQHYKMRPYAEFSRKGFYSDGRFRGTTFIVESLMRTKCFKKGNVTCGACHDPHPPDAGSNPASLKFHDHPDQMCVNCHVRYRDTALLSRHTHHAVNSAGSRCTSCHMPSIMDALLFRAHTHGIDDIPRAQRTLRFGQDESPNACLLCHTDKNTQWASARLQAWNQPAAGTHAP